MLAHLKIGHSLLFVPVHPTATKVRHSTGVATINSTNKDPNAKKLSWPINYWPPCLLSRALTSNSWYEELGKVDGKHPFTASLAMPRSILGGCSTSGSESISSDMSEPKLDDTSMRKFCPTSYSCKWALFSVQALPTLLFNLNSSLLYSENSVLPVFFILQSKSITSAAILDCSETSTRVWRGKPTHASLAEPDDMSMALPWEKKQNLKIVWPRWQNLLILAQTLLMGDGEGYKLQLCLSMALLIVRE